MKKGSYSQSVLIKANADKVFDAIAKSVQEWWGFTDKTVAKVGDEFTTSFGPTYWKFKISEYEPGKKIYWECIDSVHVHRGFENIEKEWVGTVAKWHLAQENGHTKVSFEHDGLTNELNCYEVCEPAWDMFITSSLKQFVETGKGSPHLE